MCNYFMSVFDKKLLRFKMRDYINNLNLDEFCILIKQYSL